MDPQAVVEVGLRNCGQVPLEDLTVTVELMEEHIDRRGMPMGYSSLGSAGWERVQRLAPGAAVRLRFEPAGWKSRSYVGCGADFNAVLKVTSPNHLPWTEHVYVSNSTVMGDVTKPVGMVLFAIVLMFFIVVLFNVVKEALSPPLPRYEPPPPPRLTVPPSTEKRPAGSETGRVPGQRLSTSSPSTEVAPLTTPTLELIDLAKIPITELPRLRLHPSNLEASLAALGWSRALWEDLTSIGSDPKRAIQQFAKHLDLELKGHRHLSPGFIRFRAVFPKMNLNISRDTAIFALNDTFHKLDLAGPLRADLEAAGLLGVDCFPVLIDLTRTQLLTEKLRECGFQLIVLDAVGLTRLLSGSDELLDWIVRSAQSIARLSPIQSEGGLNDSALFFGRSKELQILTDPKGLNYLIVGPRQMGKTSLLKELERRYESTLDRHAFYLCMSSTVTLADCLREHIPASMPSSATLRELVRALLESARGSQAAEVVILVDEADFLFLGDPARGYADCWELRAIANETHCRFVLAGNWVLYQAVFRDHHSPLKNLAKHIRLGPLDLDDARDAVRRLLRFTRLDAQPEAVDLIVTRTGGRPNLIAMACESAIKGLTVRDRVLTLEQATASLDVKRAGSSIADFYNDIGRLTRNRADNLIDMMVLYAVAAAPGASGGLTRKELVQTLEAMGARVPMMEIKESLTRLEVSYLLLSEREHLKFPVPLIRDYLLSEASAEPEDMLRRLSDDWRQA